MSKRSRRAERPTPAHARVAVASPSWWRLAIVLLVALIVRLIVAAEIWDLPLFRTPKLDSAEYLVWARRLASGDFAWPAVSPHGPGYPLFLASVLALGGGLKAVTVVQAVLGAMTAVMVAAIAKTWWNPTAGIVAGLAYAAYGPVVYVDTALLSEGLLLFLLTLALLLGARPQASPGRITLAGIVLGLAALVRPTALVFVLAFGVWLLLERRRALALVLAVASLIAVAPAAVKTYATTGSLSLQGYGGLNIYIGDSPLHDGRPTFRLGSGWDALNADAARAGVVEAAAQDRYYLSKTLGEIRAHPSAFAALLGAKAGWLVQSEEVRDSHSFYFFADRAPLLRILPRWWLLFALASAGVTVLWKGPSIWWVYVGAASATVILIVAGTRYRMPLVPALAIAAGAGGSVIVDAVRRRDTRAILTAIGAACAAIIVSQLAHDPRNRNLAEEWALTGSALITEHNLPDAEAAYRRAIALDPASSLAWDGLGLAQYDGGRIAEARQSLMRALEIGRDNAHAAFHLGLVDEREGKLDQAVDGYRRAVDLSPADAEMTRSLATALGLLGRSAEAREQMRRVVQLEPGNGEAWLDICLLSLNLGDVPTGVDALQRARERGADPQRLAFAQKALDLVKR